MAISLRTITVLTLLVFIGGCVAPAVPAFPDQPGERAEAVRSEVAVQVQVSPLQPGSPCSDTFVAHDLPHTTQAALPVPRLFDSNGSGLAINDLDGDGDEDIVLGDLAGPLAILWNEGGLTFTRQELGIFRRARSIALVDVDGDGALDITATNGVAAPAVFRNMGDRTFSLLPLPGMNQPAYAMNWADLDADGDLDLVTGSYDAGRQVESGSNYLFDAPAGVNVYLQQDGSWQRQQLAETAQALAISLWDLNGDDRLDIWVGNDFDEFDQVWLQGADGGWEPADFFEDTTHSTMSIDRGDLDGDGSTEYFATDMKPSTIGPQVMAQWVPLMNAAEKTRLRDDPQLSENVLQSWRGDRFVNEGYSRKIDATGWSWSGKFGDLDTDGDLDLYVVNGMIAGDLLDYLPGGELVEENQALRNDGRGQFLPAAEWGLGSTRSGRSMSMADLDGDGDLDVVVNNLNSPAQLFENRLCAAGTALTLDLRWPGPANPYALGAVVTLETDRGTLVRDVRAVSGYLSGDATQLHFGIPAGAMLEELAVRWPDGATSVVDSPAAGHHLTITRSQ
ncbi:MAG: CRTAC1 family protein [Caldilinea sp.]|nr:CRTAC1 family protein [Caldilinea sp.]